MGTTSSPKNHEVQGGIRTDISRGLRLFFSLKVKIALSFSLLLVILSSIVAFSMVRYERIFLTREGEKRANALAANLALNARDPMLTSDDLRLGPVTEFIKLDREVRYAYLVNHQGRIVYHSDSAKTGLFINDGLIPQGERGAIQAVAPIQVEGVKIGEAVVGLGIDHISLALRTTLTGLLPPLILVTVLGVVAICFLAGLHVRRLEALESAVRAVGSGDLLAYVNVSGRDEIGRLTRHFNEMVRRIKEGQQEKEKNFRETIKALATAVEAKDAYTRGHCERVAAVSKAISERMEMEADEQKDLELAAILHDIGKIGVAGKIIGKRGPLSTDEVWDMQGHSDIGAKIVGAISTWGHVALYIKHHHEHFDGSGYPDGIKGDGIPLPSRILCLLDAYDAMISHRPYRSALPREEVIKRIREGSGSQFDPEVVRVFLELENEGVIKKICAKIAEDVIQLGWVY